VKNTVLGISSIKRKLLSIDFVCRIIFATELLLLQYTDTCNEISVIIWIRRKAIKAQQHLYEHNEYVTVLCKVTMSITVIFEVMLQCSTHTKAEQSLKNISNYRMLQSWHTWKRNFLIRCFTGCLFLTNCVSLKCAYSNWIISLLVYYDK
jgi:hypothetical protein